MEATTPEERFTKIENVLVALTETQLKHDSAIRDLIVVSRTTLSAVGELTQVQKGFQEAFQQFQREFQREMASTQEWQKSTDEKLHILIETVDRIIRNR